MLKTFTRAVLAITMATAAYSSNSSTHGTNPVDDILPVTERPTCTFLTQVITLPSIPETNMPRRTLEITGGGTLALRGGDTLSRTLEITGSGTLALRGGDTLTITGGGTLILTGDALRDCLPLTFTRRYTFNWAR